MTDVEMFLTPLDGPNPSGEDLRNDARFHAIERLGEPASRRARAADLAAGGSGGAVVDWAQMLDEARGLAASGRDLRLLVTVVRALAGAEGLEGLAEGLTLLVRTVERHWDTVHPALREAPTRREAALRRINALYQLENADSGLLCDLEYLTLLTPRGLAPVRGGDLEVAMLNRTTVLAEAAEGLGAKEQAEVLAAHEARAKRVQQALKATAAERPEVLPALREAASAARKRLTALESALDERVAEGGVGVRFAALGRFLDRIEQTLAGADAAPPPQEPDRMPSASPAATPAGQPAAAAPAAALNGVPAQITSRREVERCLDMIIDFYERTEPSSPIPHLARRMRKMVPMNFLQLMEEIAPSGMKEFRGIAGVFDDKPK